MSTQIHFGLVDGLAVIFLFASLFWVLKRKSRAGAFKMYPSWFIPVLICVHYLLSILSIYYVLTYGGDAVRYWNLTADQSQHAKSWIEHWGYNTFFIQWLNYIPSKILGLNFLSGCLIYSTLSLLGFLGLAELVGPRYWSVSKKSKLFSICILLVFFIPSPHFWTGLVSKEALIWIFLIVILKSVHSSRLFLYLFMISLLVWLRPSLGIVVLGATAIYLVFLARISLTKKWVFGIAISLLGTFGLVLLIYMTGINSMGLIAEFSSGQYQFLKTFNPNTLVPMEEYSLGYKLFTVGFRPLPGEIKSGWGLILGIENLLLGILTIGILPIPFLSRSKSRRMISVSTLILSLILFFLFVAYSVNVLGIMIRLKSPLLPFWALAGCFGWFLLLQERKKPKADLNL
ncbi:hypothetical protein [Algoriphagus boritolerans]|uniref:Uncharacterized protein n=1 Tax=Algoriphagus boritolerans DSM 17298 = JCM 18970 TaxID=1120964 RepID=A0A1H5XGB1_9BACT|nr:hypothetical protein [Algoriphagus boritolerans]SEG10387.1 hypothetical protein SAMN03080598_02496 [Algoriphagus boritolerans DSM 17298 = JCM 18970]